MKGLVFKKEICDFLRRLKECVNTAFRPIVEEHGLTMMQTRVLLEIKQCEHLTVGSLCSEIGLTSGNASSLCKKLEEAGFVKRNRNPKDERFVELSLTEEAEETIQKIEERLVEKYGRFFENKSENELEELIAGMRKFSAFIQEMCTFK